MVTVQEAVRRLRIEATTRGVDEAKNKLTALAGAQGEVATASQFQERATLSMSRALERIQTRYDEAYRSEQQLARIERDLSAARAQGLISLERQAELMSLANNRIRGLTPAVSQGATGFTRFGGAIQQAGYQVGDFAVQIASGQSPLRAFVQQGSQLLGVLGPFGAIAGAAVAVGGALAATFLDLEDSAGRAAAAADAYTDAIDAGNRILKTRAQIDAIRREQELTEAIQKTTLALQEQQAQYDDLATEAARLGGFVEDPTTGAFVAGAGEFGPQLDALRRARDASGSRIIELQRQLSDLADPSKLFPEDAIERTRRFGDAAGAAATATGRLGAAASATLLSVQDLIDSFSPAAQQFQSLAQAEAVLELQFERGAISAEEYSRKLDELYKAHQFAVPIETAENVKATEFATRDAAAATDVWGRTLDRVAQSGGQAFAGLATGALTARGAVMQLLDSLAQVGANLAEEGLTDIFKMGLSFLPGLFGAGAYVSPGAATGATSSGALAGGQIGFANGGDFIVGGSGGTDSQMVRFMATPGERVSVRTPGQMMGDGPKITVVNNITVEGGAAAGDRELPNRIADKVSRATERAVLGIVQRGVERGAFAGRGIEPVRG